MVDTNGQLGVAAASSRGVKQDIAEMGDASNRLLDLRPVTFRCKEPYSDGTQPVEYGLVAEEVEQVYPDLVTKGGADRDVTIVQVYKLTPMLLNELQKETRRNQALETEVQELRSRLAAVERPLASVK
jgi:hypothetical protein